MVYGPGVSRRNRFRHAAGTAGRSRTAGNGRQAGAPARHTACPPAPGLPERTLRHAARRPLLGFRTGPVACPRRGNADRPAVPCRRDSGNVRRPPPFRARAGRFGIRLRGYAGLHHGRHPESAVEPLAVFPPAETGLARRMDSRGTAARPARGRPDQTGKPLEACRAEHPVQPALSPRQRVQPQAIVRSVRRAHAQPGPAGRHHPAPAARRSVRAAPASRIHGGRSL